MKQENLAIFVGMWTPKAYRHIFYAEHFTMKSLYAILLLSATTAFNTQQLSTPAVEMMYRVSATGR